MCLDMYETLVNANTWKFSDLTALDIVSSSLSVLSCLIPGMFSSVQAGRCPTPCLVLPLILVQLGVGPSGKGGTARSCSACLEWKGKETAPTEMHHQRELLSCWLNQGHCTWLHCSSQLAMEGFASKCWIIRWRVRIEILHWIQWYHFNCTLDPFKQLGQLVEMLGKAAGESCCKMNVSYQQGPGLTLVPLIFAGTI